LEPPIQVVPKKGVLNGVRMQRHKDDGAMRYEPLVRPHGIFHRFVVPRQLSDPIGAQHRSVFDAAVRSLH
jgi:hypothetical protein